jgi:TBC1 domain family member 2
LWIQLSFTSTRAMSLTAKGSPGPPKLSDGDPNRDDGQLPPLEQGLAAIRLSFSSDLGGIQSFFSDTFERARPKRSDSAGGTPAHRSATTSGDGTPHMLPTASKDEHALKPTCSRAKSTPHSPRSVLRAIVPDGVLQRESMALLLLQASPEQQSIRNACWKGCSARNRALVWRTLLGDPLSYAERSDALAERRREYEKLQRIMGGPAVGDSGLDGRERTGFSLATLRQIDVDLPRTHPTVPVFRGERVRSAMRRILYLFAAVHPESGYVQGMNEILSPLIIVFMSEHVAAGSKARHVEGFLELDSLADVLREEKIAEAEADSYWCFAELVSGVLDNYTAGQPGMHRRMAQLGNLVRVVDPPLAAHLEAEGCHAMQFAFRWISVLMLREFRLPLVVKLWDALLGQVDGFGSFLVYLSAALIVNWRDELLAMEFADIVVHLLHMPTGSWSDQDVNFLLAQACLWSREHKLDRLERPRSPSPGK